MNGVQKHVVITMGEAVTANKFAEEFNLTADKKYLVKGHENSFFQICCIQAWYTVFVCKFFTYAQQLSWWYRKESGSSV